MRMLGTIILALLVTVGVFAYLQPQSRDAAIPTQETADIVIARAELVVRNWDDFRDKKTAMPPSRGRINSAQDALSKIGTADPRYASAQRVLNALETKSRENAKAAEAAENAERINAAVEARKSYAARIEDLYLKQGRDFRIRTEGQGATTLRIQWVLIGRPFVYNSINDADLTATWRGLGFKTVIFTDGYENTWRQNVQ